VIPVIFTGVQHEAHHPCYPCLVPSRIFKEVEFVLMVPLSFVTSVEASMCMWCSFLAMEFAYIANASDLDSTIKPSSIR